MGLHAALPLPPLPKVRTPAGGGPPTKSSTSTTTNEGFVATRDGTAVAGVSGSGGLPAEILSLPVCEHNGSSTVKITFELPGALSCQATDNAPTFPNSFSLGSHKAVVNT